MPGTAEWLFPDGAAWGQGTRVTLWEVAGAGTHLPSSVGCNGEQRTTFADSGCWEVQGTRICHARLFHWQLAGHHQATAPVKLENLKSGAGHWASATMCLWL